MRQTSTTPVTVTPHEAIRTLVALSLISKLPQFDDAAIQQLTLDIYDALPMFGLRLNGTVESIELALHTMRNDVIAD
jgi:RIO-like serine/threonine protein kinase